MAVTLLGKKVLVKLQERIARPAAATLIGSVMAARGSLKEASLTGQSVLITGSRRSDRRQAFIYQKSLYFECHFDCLDLGHSL